MNAEPRHNTHTQLVSALGRLALEHAQTDRALPTEPELCERFEVSRGALREAVKALVAKGILEVRPRTGTRVRPRHEWNHIDPDVLHWLLESERGRVVIELNELRDAIEPKAAALAAEHADSEVLSKIWRHFLAMEDAVAQDDLAAFVEADTRFHEEILGAGGNEYLRSIGHVIEAVLEEGFSMIADETASVAASVPLHRAVVDAVSRRDADAAAEAMRQVIAATVRRTGLSRTAATTSADPATP